MKDNKSSIFHHVTRDPVQNTMIASLEEQYGGHQIGFER